MTAVAATGPTPEFAKAAERFALERFAALEGDETPVLGALDAAAISPALDKLADGFDLEPGEVALLALQFAAAWSEQVGRKIVSASPDSGGRGLPLWLILRMLPELDAAALAPGRSLRRFGLIDLESGTLRIEARVSLSAALTDRFALGCSLPPELLARIRPAEPDSALADSTLTGELAGIFSARGRDRLSPVAMTGRIEPAVLAASLAPIGLHLHCIRASAVPDDADRRDELSRHWSREAALESAALLILVDPDAPVSASGADFVERVMGHVLITGTSPPQMIDRAIRMIEERGRASSVERWRSALGPARSRKLGSAVARIAGQFRLQPSEIDSVCAQAAAEIDAARGRALAEQRLWHRAARVVETAPTPGVLVVEPVFDWGDIVLAPPIAAALKRIESHVRHAAIVLDEWGFSERLGGRGHGVAALFSGPSGTGKTMAAEVLAKALDVRMMLIDLSQIISKYVGETSKNIAAAFEQAERCGAVMVWNEGDAVWGSRGSVGNATDRHVNAEVGDLLQRIEAFRGFTVVTTNMKQAIDPAFMRRFRFVIDFPMPARTERLRMWKNAFPRQAPVESIEWEALAGLPLTGGSIRNIALGSAFLAADRGQAIGRDLISAEIGEELRKQNQPVPQIVWSNGS